jgi:hypothetical protein
MTLVERIADYLDQRGVESALIGGMALAVHGIARATLDADLLVADRIVLDRAFWVAWKEAEPEVRAGDVEDPLAGVVRCSQGAEAVDVIVAKHTWQAQILQRRISVMVEGRSLPVVDTADLVLLKLYAGGPQDLLDIRLLLAAGGGTLCREVEERLADLPPSLRAIFNDCRR